jgi:hypothetical protein
MVVQGDYANASKVQFGDHFKILFLANSFSYRPTDTLKPANDRFV